ncbi:MAG: hydantoinase/oxoprolinase family protein [Nitrososphaerales archaeon]
MTNVIAVDSGGTFTDCVVVDSDGKVTTAKSPSTPADFSVGVLAAVTRTAEAMGLGLEALLADTGLFAHGTTVATNALLTRSGPKVGLITTKGHEDALIIGRTIQKAAGLAESELTNLARLEKAIPLVPRPLIKGVTERVDYKGAVIVPLDLDEARRAADELVAAGVEAIAICFLWSFLLPEHEQAVHKMITTKHPEMSVSSSHEVAPVIKEYERGASTVLNAYLGRDTDAYISALQDKLSAAGLRRDPVIMQSVGGVTSATDAKGHAISLLSSGPAGGVLGAAALGELIGSANVVTTDVGGTSFDVGLVVDGEPVITGTPVFDKYHTVLPVIDVTSIGAGGGSIAWIEPGTGHLKVGPQSAGADPGPACYGTGGERPTVTDANVVLGRIDPEHFLGGARRLDVRLAEAAIRDHVATSLGVSVVEAAMGIVDILDARMADLVRMETIGRGYDPREFALFAFGGAGPLHVGAYGIEVGAKPIVVPSHSSVFSAYGIAGSDLVQVNQASDPMIAPFDPERLTAVYNRMEQATLACLESNGISRDHVTLYRETELRYRGQVHEVRVPVPAGDLGSTHMDEILADFEQRYNRRYGRGAAYQMAGIEARTFLVRGVGRLLKPEHRPVALGTPDPAAARTGERPVYFRELGGFGPTPIYRREALAPGNVVPGPAIIEAVDTTVLLHPGQNARVDGWTNLLLESAS